MMAVREGHVHAAVNQNQKPQIPASLHQLHHGLVVNKQALKIRMKLYADQAGSPNPFQLLPVILVKRMDPSQDMCLRDRVPRAGRFLRRLPLRGRKISRNAPSPKAKTNAFSHPYINGFSI